MDKGKPIAVEGGCASAAYLVLGMIHNNCYLIDDGDGGVVVVDPSTHADAILEAAGDRPVAAVLVTHCHWDHIGALAELCERTGAPAYASAIDAPTIADPIPPHPRRPIAPHVVENVVSGGDKVCTGALCWRVIPTPGHTPGGVCYYLESNAGTNPQGAPMLLSGDTLFCASIGRTDFPGGSMDDMRTSLSRLAKLPDETLVLPGHGELTTIGAERARTIEFFMGR